MKFFDFESWLRSRSTKVERSSGELIFTHFNGETSVLLPRDKWHDGLLSVDVEQLAHFYDRYFGASIGNSQMTFATNVIDGIYVSHGFKLLDFEQMTAQANRLGFKTSRSERVFLATAGWMFIYTASAANGDTVMRKYDRQYSTYQAIENLEDVLNDWWNMIRAE